MAIPPQFLKKGSKAEDRKDGGKDDARETPVKPFGPNPKKKGKGGLPPALQAAIARKLGQGK